MQMKFNRRISVFTCEDKIFHPYYTMIVNGTQ